MYENSVREQCTRTLYKNTVPGHGPMHTLTVFTPMGCCLRGWLLLRGGSCFARWCFCCFAHSDRLTCLPVQVVPIAHVPSLEHVPCGRRRESGKYNRLESVIACPVPRTLYLPCIPSIFNCTVEPACHRIDISFDGTITWFLPCELRTRQVPFRTHWLSLLW